MRLYPANWDSALRALQRVLAGVCLLISVGMLVGIVKDRSVFPRAVEEILPVAAVGLFALSCGTLRPRSIPALVLALWSFYVFFLPTV